MSEEGDDALYCLSDIRAAEARYGPLAQPRLMEQAGIAAASDAIRILGDRPGPVLVLAGPGNNGGDGFVVARLLREAGRDVVLACSAPDLESLPSDASLACRAWLQSGGMVAEDFVADNNRWALIVDALLGIGNSRALDGRIADWVRRINGQDCPVLALDIPSGLNPDSGMPVGDLAVVASHTATFIGLKAGLLTARGPDHCGRVTLHRLGLPALQTKGRRLTIRDFVSALQARPAFSHKGNYGQAVIVGGAPGMVGAALLAARAALKLGAGRVYVAGPEETAVQVDPMQPELMMRPLDQALALATAVVIGPGLSRSDSALHAMQLALHTPCPLVIDADALNLLADQGALRETLLRRDADVILTPHPAEAARLLAIGVDEVQCDRVGSALELAARFRAAVVLKGNGSVIALRDGRWFINTTGNAGLASAGTGDVLAGLVGALLAQRWSAEHALLGAIHLHGAAADRLVSEGIGPVGMTASELADAARATFNTWIADARSTA